MAQTKVKLPQSPLVRRTVTVDRLPGTRRESLRCPICERLITLDSRPHYH